MMFTKLSEKLKSVATSLNCVTCDKPVPPYSNCVECHKPVHGYGGCSTTVYDRRNGRRISNKLCKKCEEKPAGDCVQCKKSIGHVWDQQGHNVCSYCGKPMHRGCGHNGPGQDDKLCHDCLVKVNKSFK